MKNAKDLLLQLESEIEPEKRVDLIVELTEILLNSDLSRCEIYASQLLDIGETNDMPIALMHHHLVLGRINYRKADLNGSFAQYTVANEWAVKIDHKIAQANVLESKGTLMHKWGKHKEALELSYAALQIYQQEKVNKVLIGMCYNSIANAYDSMKQNKEAKENYLLAIEALENSENKQTIDFVKGNLGLLLLNQKEYNEALEYFNNSLKGFLAANQVQAQGLTYHYIAQCNMGLNSHAKALEYYHLALKLLKHSRYYNELSIVYMGLGTLYRDLGGHSHAEVYFNKALEMRLLREFWHGACQSYLALYHLYVSMNELEMAKDIIISGKGLAIKQQLHSWITDFDALLMELE
jgi:tetratricopeptide (TPR) repeat protein